MSVQTTMRRYRIEESKEAWKRICDRSLDSESETEKAVAEMIRKVRTRGDLAVAEYTLKFDKRSPNSETGSFEIAQEAMKEAWETSSKAVQVALEISASRIRNFHKPQRVPSYEKSDGRLSLRSTPLAKVGLYVPGGTALYPSSVLMTAIPAQVAGVGEIVMVTPGASRETLAAAYIAGVHRVFEIGGAQAVAALAYGTESVPRVDKIVGPGNQWVATAKRQVFGQVDIDSIAGPSEVLVIADASADARFVAADILAQAEHDVIARTILLSDSEELLDAVDEALSVQIETLPRCEIARASIAAHGVSMLVPDIQRAIALSNEYAPEHLELALQDAASYVDAITNAGAIFVGHYSPEAAGDYSAGPNHVLPTGGAARYASPLGVYDFCKFTSILAMTRAELQELRVPITTLAQVEGLHAHGRSVDIRFEGPATSGLDDT